MSKDSPKTKMLGWTVVSMVFFFAFSAELFEVLKSYRLIRICETVPVTILFKTISRVEVPRRSARILYSPIIHYQYQFRGASYTGSYLTPLGSPLEDFQTAQLDISPFEVGKTYAGWVNPQRPTESYLRKEHDTGSLTLMAICGIISIVSGIFAARVKLGRAHQERV